jgi:hypothetical protein
MSFLPSLIGGAIGIRTAYTAGGQIAKSSFSPQAFGKAFLQGPLIQGGSFGVGYTSGAYGGYGITNTADPFGIHKPKYKYKQMNLGMPYGYGYGRGYRRRYRRRYRYSRYSSYGSRYGRRRPYYRRRFY